MGYFKGGQDEIAYALGVSRKTANEILGRLEARNLIEKSIVYNEKEKRKETVITSKVTKGYNSKVTILPDQSNDSLQTYNKEDNNKDNNIPPLYPPKGETPSKKENSAKAKSTPQVPLAPLPYHSAKFNEVWEFLCSMPKWKNKTNYALNISIKKLSQVTEAEAIGMIEEAIEKGWQGIFLPKDKQQSIRKPKYVDIKDIM